MRNISIMIVGVGGQGTLLTSRVVGAAAVKAGYDVKCQRCTAWPRGAAVLSPMFGLEKV